MARLRDVRGRRDPGGYVKYLTREDREPSGGQAAGIKEKDYIMKLNRHISNICLFFAVTALSTAAAFAQRPNDNPREGDRGLGPASQTGGGRSETLLDLYRDEDGAVEITKIPSHILSERFAEALEAADKNKDGRLDAAEERALFEAIDGGRGGRFSDGRRPDMPRGGEGTRGGGPQIPAPRAIAKKRTALSEAEKNNLEGLRRQMIQDGVAFLASRQSESGSFSESPRVGIGPTLIAAMGLLRAGVKLDEPVLAKTMKFLEKSVHEDGGVYSDGMHLSTYESCIGLVCFMLANERAGDGRYDEIIKNAEKFVRGSQFNSKNGVTKNDEYFGGVGYGADSMTRPDLSNTQFFIEALREVGAGEDDPAIQDALVFVSRCQNLESTDSVGLGSGKSGAKTTNDGGFIYTFVSEQENPAGQEVSGGLRSYGSMTYAGLKSLIYAGLDANDPRVEAATNWIRDNYTLEQNPGLGKRGLYYYYHTLSKCLNVIGDPTVTDKEGVKRDWRAELVETLALAENEDGSWANDDRMWFETDPSLVTGYVLTVLSYCEKE